MFWTFWKHNVCRITFWVCRTALIQKRYTIEFNWNQNTLRAKYLIKMYYRVIVVVVDFFLYFVQGTSFQWRFGQLKELESQHSSSPVLLDRRLFSLKTLYKIKVIFKYEKNGVIKYEPKRARIDHDRRRAVHSPA